MFHGQLDYLQKPPLEGRPHTKPGDHDIPNTHNIWFILFHHVWESTWIETHWNSIWSRTQSHMTSHYTWGSVTTLHGFGGALGWPWDTFLLGSHNFMVTALGSCVKWPHTLGQDLHGQRDVTNGQPASRPDFTSWVWRRHNKYWRTRKPSQWLP